MRARPLRILVAAAVCICVSSVAGSPSAVAAPGESAPPLRLEVIGSSAGGLDQLISLIGAPHDVDVAVRVTNPGTRVERNVVVRVATAASAASTMPVDLAPGQTVTSVLTVSVSGLPGAEHGIEASVGPTSVEATYAQLPWLLVAVAALGLHIVALTARDRLRAHVARATGRAGDQPSPSQTWARSSRYSETS